MLLKRIPLKPVIVASFLLIIAGGLLFNTERLQKQVVSVLLYPFLVAEREVVEPVMQWLYWRRGVAALREVAIKYEQERNELLKKNIELEARLDFIKESQEAAEFKIRYDSEQAVIGHVLLKSFSQYEHFFFVGAGLSRGIKKDMVAVYQNNLIGRVSEVYPWYCKVLLVTDRNCHVAATCAQTGAHGIHVGTNSLENTYMGFVNHLDDLNKGDLVISHGKGLIFPRGFALGRVESYHQEGVQYHVSVEPLIDLRRIEFCTIIEKSG